MPLSLGSSGGLDSMRHKLKIEDTHYQNIIDGRKKFEVRYNDRDYQLGDEIEFTDTFGCGERNGLFKIIFVHSGYGMANCFVILGIQILTHTL